MAGRSDQGALVERIENSLRLGALGDWLGSPVEGAAAVERTLDWSYGSLTDDTLLTLATASSIAEFGAVDPASIARHLVAAYRRGVPGMGSSTLGALRALSAGQHWSLSGISGDRAAGNGAAMRIAPVALVVDLAVPNARRVLRDVARITHRNDEASVGALALGLGINAGLANRTDRAKTLRWIAAELPDTNVRDQVLVAADLGAVRPDEAADALGSSGYVAHSVPLALYLGLGNWSSPIAALEAAATVSEDSDTIASMVGQLLGASGHQTPDDAPDLDLNVDLRALARQLQAARVAM